MTRHIFVVLGLAAIVTFTAAAGAMAQLPGDTLEISAFAVNMSNIATGSTGNVEITVTNWSPEAERDRLVTTMTTKGADALLRELQKTPVKGRFRIPTARQPDPHHLALGLDLHYAWQEPLPEGGRRIVLATDRYIDIREARNKPRTIDYPFTLIEIRVDKDGNGEGKMSVATKISFDKKKNVIELENYSSEPVRLQNVKVTVKP